jgi:SAM-dependent methyltransferase
MVSPEAGPTGPFNPTRTVLNGDAGPEVIRDYEGANYPSVWEKPREQFSRDFEDRIVRELVQPSAGWFLDLCSGFGRNHPLYAQAGRTAVLVDYSRSLLELATENHWGASDLHTVLASAYHLPFRSGAFSGGISIRAFHHMSDPERFLGECGRVLRTGAHLLVSYSNKRNALRSVRHPRSARRRDHEEHPNVHFVTHPDYFAATARDAGFEIAATRGTGFLRRVVTGRTAASIARLKPLEMKLDSVLGPAGLAPITFVDLVKRRGVGDTGEPEPSGELPEMLRCPACRGELLGGGRQMECADCYGVYPAVRGAIDFRYPRASIG